MCICKNFPLYNFNCRYKRNQLNNGVQLVVNEFFVNKNVHSTKLCARLCVQHGKNALSKTLVNFLTQKEERKGVKNVNSTKHSFCKKMSV